MIISPGGGVEMKHDGAAISKAGRGVANRFRDVNMSKVVCGYRVHQLYKTRNLQSILEQTASQSF